MAFYTGILYEKITMEKSYRMAVSFFKKKNILFFKKIYIPISVPSLFPPPNSPSHPNSTPYPLLRDDESTMFAASFEIGSKPSFLYLG